MYPKSKCTCIVTATEQALRDVLTKLIPVTLHTYNLNPDTKIESYVETILSEILHAEHDHISYINLYTGD